MYKRLCSVHLNPDIATDDKKTLNCSLQQHALCTSHSSVYEYAMHTTIVCIGAFRCCNQTYFIYLFVSHGNKCMNTLLIAHPDERESNTQRQRLKCVEIRWGTKRSRTELFHSILKFENESQKTMNRIVLDEGEGKAILVWLLAQIIQSNFIPCCALFTLSVESVVFYSASCS